MSRSARRPTTTVQIIQKLIQHNILSAPHVFSRLPHSLPVFLVGLLFGQRLGSSENASDIVHRSG